jgi:Domain of unknown function (DUF4331)
MRLRSMTPAAVAGAAYLAMGCSAFAASHREAPLIAMDPSADITDTYAFVSYDETNLAASPANRKVTFIMNVIPGQDPADGPNYFAFGDDVLYEINIDNDADGKADDVVYRFRFTTENRPLFGVLDTPLAFVGGSAQAGPPPGGDPITPGITALDGPGSEGIIRRQTYTVTEVRGSSQTVLFRNQKLIAVPSNVGPSTTAGPGGMPDYENLASQGIYEDGAVRVFAGQRAETFYIDLGATFDTLNFRRNLPALSAMEDANDAADPFGINRFSGTDINTIAIEVPISRITSDGVGPDTTNQPVIGVYASTSRQAVRVLSGTGRPRNSGKFVQVARLANPLVNELIIDTPFKDQWNATDPRNEAQFLRFYRTPTIATALNILFGVAVPATPRNDLAQLLLKYPGQLLPSNGRCGTPCAELLRLDVSEAPTAAEMQSRLGAALGGDPAGFPNGRRPNDDATDIVVRVAGGSNYIGARVGDGVNFINGAPGAGTGDGPGYGLTMGNRLDVTANGIAKEFPFLPTPYDGRNRRHIDCGEMGANPCN